MQPTKNLFIVCIVSWFFIACKSGYVFNQKYGPNNLKEDVIVLQKVVEANHPSLYWYTPKDSIDWAFKNTINSITDSLTESQFKNKLATLVSNIRCGHTMVLFSKNFRKAVSKHIYPLFPLQIKTWDDSLVVIENLYPNDSILKPGTIITGINYRSNRQILDSLFKNISTDGYSTNFKSQSISFNFPGWYKTVFGTDSLYKIDYIDSVGKKATTFVKAYYPPQKTESTDSSKTTTIRKHTIRKTNQLGESSVKIDTALNTAWMNLNSFSAKKLRRFFRRSFKDIQKKNVQNLVIELRLNGGGKLDNYILLTKYLSDTAFKITDTVAAKSRSLKNGKYIGIGNALFYKLLLRFSTKKTADNRYHDVGSEAHYYWPKSKYHFNGNIYIIQGGYTFSAATMFVSSLKGQKNVTVIGEETGGGNYGNSAMQIVKIKLPNSKLRVTLPLFRVVINHHRNKDGRGIMPDINVPTTSYAIKHKIDLKEQKVKQLIKEKTKQ